MFPLQIQIFKQDSNTYAEEKRVIPREFWSFDRSASERLVPPLTRWKTSRSVAITNRLCIFACLPIARTSIEAGITFVAISRNSITSPPDILLLFFLIHYPAENVQRDRESAPKRCGPLERRLDCSLIGKKKNSVINTSMRALPKILRSYLLLGENKAAFCMKLQFLFSWTVFYDAVSTLCCANEQLANYVLSNSAANFYKHWKICWWTCCRTCSDVLQQRSGWIWTISWLSSFNFYLTSD